MPIDNHTSSSPVRIVYISHTAQLGGGELALLRLVQRIDPNRFSLAAILFENGPLVAKLSQAGVDVEVFLLPSRITETRKDSLGFKSLLRLREMAEISLYVIRLARKLRASRASLVHTNSLKADVIGGMAARIAMIPLVWHVRDRIEEGYLPGVVVKVMRGLARLLPKRVIANSASTLQTLGPQVVQTGLVVPSGVVLDDYQETSPWTQQNAGKPRVVGLIGRLVHWKGQHIFIEAASSVIRDRPETQFQLIGGPMFGQLDYEKQLRQLVSDFGITKNVEFLGQRDDVPDLLQKLDILVHASVTAEPFGQVVVEGQAAGRPVIGTNGGGVAEIIEQGVTGLLVRMGDVDEMTAAILELLDDDALATRLAAAGRKHAFENYSIDVTVSRVQQLYDELLKSK